MKYPPLSIINFLRLTKMLVFTNGLLLVTFSVHFWAALKRFNEFHEVSSALRFSWVPPLLYLLADGAMIVNTSFLLTVKVILFTKTYLNDLTNRLYGWSLLLAWLLCVFYVTSCRASWSLEQGLHQGADKFLSKAMKGYSFDHKLKSALDKIQIRFKCCGVHSPKDWRSVSWYLEGLTGPASDMHNADHVPFSCCASSSGSPCIHHWIISSRHQYRDPQSELLWREGCGSSVTRSWRRRLYSLRFWALTIFGLTAVDLVLEMVLQAADGRVAVEGVLE